MLDRLTVRARALVGASLVAGALILGSLGAAPVAAAGSLSITPITWNVIGIDSNLKTGETVGPNVFPVGARGRVVYLTEHDKIHAESWVSQGFGEVLRTPDSTLIFVDSARARQIRRDQIDCMGCLSACQFSNWAQNEDGTTGKLPDPRSYCIQKTLQAIADANKGLELGSSLPFAGYYNRAVAEHLSGDLQHAYFDYQKVLELSPDLYEAHINFGQVLLRAKQPAEALPHLKRAREQKPGEFKPAYFLAETLFDLNQFSDAMPAFAAASALDPKSAPAELGWGRCLLRLDRRDEALPHYRTALELAAHQDKRLLADKLRAKLIWQAGGVPTPEYRLLDERTDHAALAAARLVSREGWREWSCRP
mgnify:CR=1 FL=1